MANSIRLEQLKKLAGAMPVANQKVAAGLQAGQQVQFQNAIKGANPGAGTSAAQSAGAQQAAALAAPVLQANQTSQQQTGQIANLSQNQQGLENAAAVSQRQSGIVDKGINQNNRLAQLSNDIKNQLLDDQLKFNQDERGRVLLNDRQLADAAILTAKNEQDLLNYKQNIQQMNSRKLQAMEVAYNKLAQAMKTGYTDEGQRLDFQTKVDIKNMMMNAEKDIRALKNKQEANQAAWSAAGTVVGTIIGAIYGGPGGAKAGGQAGGAGGGYAGSQG